MDGLYLQESDCLWNEIFKKKHLYELGRIYLERPQKNNEKTRNKVELNYLNVPSDNKGPRN